MHKKLNAVGYGDTCNNNINIFYTCIRIAKKKRNRYRVVIKDIHLIFWNTVSNVWDFFKLSALRFYNSVETCSIKHP